MGTTHLCHQRAVLLHPDVWCGALDFRHEIAGANVIFGGHAAVLTVAATNPFLAGSLNALKEISLCQVGGCGPRSPNPTVRA